MLTIHTVTTDPIRSERGRLVAGGVREAVQLGLVEKDVAVVAVPDDVVALGVLCRESPYDEETVSKPYIYIILTIITYNI